MVDPTLKRRKFVDAWLVIRDEILVHFKSKSMPPDAVEWFTKSLDYNVPGGKLNRGLSVVDTAEILKGRELTDEEYLQASVLGWTVEMLQAVFLVSDDLTDGSITRRGQPCWYRALGVGLTAVNDAFMIEGAIYFLLQKHFRQETYYVDLLELFHGVTYKTEFGQLVDLITAPEDNVDLSKFSLTKHHTIVVYKTAFYSFYLPVALALYLCAIPESYQTKTGQTVHPLKTSLDILIPLGEYFQVQDDFLDYAGTPEQIGKIGTDIVDNKCSWCINTALALVNEEQRKVLDENYGKKDAAAEARVKELYGVLNIAERYHEYEEKVVGELREKIKGIPEDGDVKGELKRQVFTSFLEKVYKRQK